MLLKALPMPCPTCIINDYIPPLIHRDISSGNILLDSKFKAVISDFGMTRLLDPDSSNQTLIAGTYGYIALGNCIPFLDFDTLGKKILLNDSIVIKSR